MIIGIMGESGAGKTTSLRNLNPAETFYIDCDKKGLSWKGWRDGFSGEKKNYLKTDFPQVALQALQKVNTDKAYKHIKVLVVDTINGIMVDDEMTRMNEKGYDKWVDLAVAVYGIINYALTMRDDITVVFVAHTQTERDDGGNTWTRVKTSGKKLDKLNVESKLTTVLHAVASNGRYIFRTRADSSTAKAPLGAFSEDEIDNDITLVLKALEDY